VINERVVRDGHYLIVTSGGRAGLALVACQGCGLRDLQRFDGRPGEYDAVARALARRVLARFRDPSCDSVRLQLLAEHVMES